MAKKAINIQHQVPGRLPYAILPIGTYCNQKLQEAKAGAVVEFWQDWRHEKRVLVRKCRIPIRSSLFAFMAQSIYGKYTRVDSLIKRWEGWAITEGIGRNGIDRETALLIEVRNIQIEDDV